jgi:PAS domain S-box-containing protein
LSGRRRAWRLRSLLVGQFLAAMAVALVVLATLMVFWRLPMVNQEAREEQSRVADLALFALEQALDNTQDQMRVLAGLRDAQYDRGVFPAATQRLLGSDNLLDGIYLLDEGMRLRQAYLRPEINARAEEWRGNDLSGVEVLQRAKALRALQWSGQFLSPVQGRAVVALALPVPGGFLMGEVSMDGLVLLTNRLNQRDGLLMLAVDQQGELVSAPNLKLVRERTNLRNLELVRAALAGVQAHGSFDHDGARYSGTARRSERLGWGLLVAYPEQQALASRNAALFITGITLLLTLALGVAMSVWLARRIDQLVRGVTGFAQQVAAGRYDGRAPRSGILELRRLGADLEQVARAIGQRERMLAEQDKRFRELVENTADLVIEMDHQGRLRYHNPSALEALAPPGAELLGRPIVELVGPGDRERVQRFITAGAQLRHHSYRQDLRMLDGRGGERDIAWSTSVDRASDGSLQGYRCIGIDVTAQRAAEMAVRRSEERLRAILESTPTLAVQWFDAQGRIIEWNPASTSLLGWTREEALGRTLGDLIYTPAQQAAFQAMLVEIERTGAPCGPYEGEIRSRNGQPRWLMSTTLRVAGESEQGPPPSIFVCMDIDITDRKRAEAELRELNVRLEDRIAERTRSLSLANTELEQALKTVQLAQERLVTSQDRLVQAEKLASLGSLVAGVAHELNTPIGNGRIAVSTLRERVREFRQQMAGGLRRSDLEGFVAQVETGGDIALRNLGRASDLLTSFKQVAVDQTSDQRRHFHLHEVVDEILLTLQPSFKRGSHRIECRVPTDIELDSYPGALGQVLTNLVQNAQIHGLENVPHGVIEIEAQPSGDELRLTVADNGRGIPETVHRHVFDPFFTTKLGQGGSGLGLPIVRNIVTGALGGAIDFRNRPGGGGVVFEVRIPRVAPQRTSPPIPEPA